MQVTNKGVWTLVRVTVGVSTDHKRQIPTRGVVTIEGHSTDRGKRIVEKGRYMISCVLVDLELLRHTRARFSQTK